MPNPTDPTLYPHHRPKTTPLEISTSSSLAFTSTLSSLLSQPQSTSRGRPRPSKQKEDIFATHNKNAKKRAAKDLEEDDERGRASGRGGKLEAVDGEVLHRSKRKMEEKVRRYNELKHTVTAGEGDEGDLVDFDRKWAERDGHESSDDDAEDDGRNEIVNYEDEYGRTRQGTKAEAAKVERRKRNALLGAEELDRMSARPVQPSKLIYGDTVQTLAFNPEQEIAGKMEELAKKRDRSMTPPDMKHYEADKEFRIKGVGFYGFSKDEALRKEEMENLEKERLETGRIRKEREEKKEVRKREIEERRKLLGAKRAKRQADDFLDGLGSGLGEKG